MEQVVKASEISVDRLLALTTEVSSKESEISSLNRELGSKDQLIESLERQIEELKSKQPEVKITTITKNSSSPEVRQYNPYYPEIYTDPISDYRVEYRNLSSVQDDIRKEIEAKFKKDLESNEKTIKDLNKKLSTINEENQENTEKLTKQYNKDIESLEEEIDKLKNNKDNETIIATRDKEVNDLKTEIKSLKAVVKDLMNRSFWQRVFGINKEPQVVLSDPDMVTEWQRNARTSIYDSLYHTWRTITRG